MTMTMRLKRLWVRGLQKGTLYANRNKRFGRLYQVNDPWEMASDREQFRFRETNRIIEKHFGRVGSLLEIGCGEGHQTEHLTRVCTDLSGFDVSATAVERAARRCPGARLVVAELSSYQPPTARFDLVVACEILYYVKDVRAAIRRMEALGTRCLVTYFQSGPCVLDEFLKDIPGLDSHVIEAGDSSWKVASWTSR